MVDDRFDADYFEHGRELGISWYQGYHWMPERSHAEARAFLDAVGVNGQKTTVTDYGCAKGFLVRAFLEQGHDARGVDVSRYALGCAPAACVGRLHHVEEADGLAPTEFGVCKDVLEHSRTEVELRETLRLLARLARRWLLIVPLAEGGLYRIPAYECDSTHVVREDEAWWVATVERCGHRVVKKTHRVPGLKDNWAEFADGNLFLFTERGEG